MTTASLDSAITNDDALAAMLAILDLCVEATGSDIAALGEARGHCVLEVDAKGDNVALVPPPPAVARAADRAIEAWQAGPILLNLAGHARTGMPPRDGCVPWRPALASRLHAGIRTLRHTVVTTTLGAGSTCETSRSPPGALTRADQEVRQSARQPRTNYILAAKPASAT